MTSREERIAVIGGGLGGLAAACTLAARGYRVTLLEKNTWFGGKAAVLEEQGFRFDMGPTILTVPRVLERIAVGVEPDGRARGHADRRLQPRHVDSADIDVGRQRHAPLAVAGLSRATRRLAEQRPRLHQPARAG